jgi:AraC-like DNA-binding protein/multisubunit Na+/H+ antiporter MnhB subunit
MAMASGGVFYAIVTAPFFPKSSLWWTLPVLSAQPVVFLLWARTAFDDDFVLRRWHVVLWLSVLSFGFVLTLGWTRWPDLAKAGGKILASVALVLALAVVVQTIKTWRNDLIAQRRQLRLAMLVICVIFIGLTAGASVSAIPVAVPGGPDSLPTAFSLFVVAMLAGFSAFGMQAAAAVNDATAAIVSGEVGRSARVVEQAGFGRVAVDPLLLRRLDHLMTVKRVYRQEGLAIGALAAEFDVPEYRLRQVINEGLGYRNFNAFLNHYRIEDAKTALSDTAQREVPVLTIAMDAGFRSIGPFNRAFKAETGMTPSEFRRQALIQTQTTSGADHDFEIGQRHGVIG